MRFALVCLIVISFSNLGRAADEDIAALVSSVSQDSYTASQHELENMGKGGYGGALYDQTTRGRLFSGTFGDKGNQEARKYLMERFAGMGLSAAIQGAYYNVVAEQTGSVHPDNILILCAHYDSRKSSAPGGDGDASGVAGVLQLAGVLSQYKFENTIRYILFNAGEKGFRGSADYARNVFGLGKEKLVGVVDLNAILHPYHDKNPAAPSAIAIGFGGKDPAAVAWAAAFTAAAAKFTPALPLDSGGPYPDGKSDFYSFVQYQYLAALRLSENSGNTQANASLGTANDASNGTAGAHYDYAFATQVVQAAVAFAAQQAVYVGARDGSAALFPDSDNDGYPDEIETAFGSDPFNAANCPFNLPPAKSSGFLEAVSMVVSLNFTQDLADAVTATGQVPIPAGFAPKDSTAFVDMGGVVRVFTLNAAGGGVKGTDTFSIRFKSSKGTVAEQFAVFSFSIGNGNFKKQFARYGLIAANYTGKPVTVPLTIIVGGETRSTARILLYNSASASGGVAR